LRLTPSIEGVGTGDREKSIPDTLVPASAWIGPLLVTRTAPPQLVLGPSVALPDALP